VLIQKKQEPAKSAKLAANLLTGEISRLLNDGNEVLSKIKVKSIHIADLVEKLILNEISSTAARMIIGEIWVSGKEVEKIIEEKGLRQVSDKSELEKYADQVIDQNPEQAADYRNGKEKLLGFFVGQTMKLTKGKANPAFIKEIIEKKLKK